MSEPLSRITAVGRGLRRAGDDAQRNRSTEDLQVVVVDLIFQAGLADLIETVKLVEIDRIAIGHQHSMEGDGKALLAESGDLLRFAQNERAFRESAHAGDPGCRPDSSPSL